MTPASARCARSRLLPRPRSRPGSPRRSAGRWGRPLLSTANHEVAEVVDLEAPAAPDDGGRAILVDDRRPLGLEPGRQVVAVEEHVAAPESTRPGSLAAGGRGPLQLRPLDEAEPGDLPVHELHHLPGPVGVAVGALVRVMERGD